MWLSGNKIARQPNQSIFLFKWMHVQLESQRNPITTEEYGTFKKWFQETLSIKHYFSLVGSLNATVDATSYSSAGGLELTVSPSSEPIEEEPVVLRCKADRLIYRNLAWFRLSGAFDSESTTSVQPCRSLTLAQLPLSQAALSCLPGAKLSLELPLASASRHDEGMYVCQVENIKTREKICLLRSLTLRGTCSPLFLLSLYLFILLAKGQIQILNSHILCFLRFSPYVPYHVRSVICEECHSHPSFEF